MNANLKEKVFLGNVTQWVIILNLQLNVNFENVSGKCIFQQDVMSILYSAFSEDSEIIINKRVFSYNKGIKKARKVSEILRRLNRERLTKQNSRRIKMR